MSTYGFENTREVLLGQASKLVESKENYDKHYMANMTAWWKRKASSRYENLTTENKVRHDQEIWTEESMNKIDIIR